MSNYAIVTDSACDLSKDLRQRFGIDDYVKGNVICPDGRTIKADCDWEQFTPNEYFSSMANKKQMYHTSTPSLEEIHAVLEKQLLQGKDILAIVLSTGLSGMYGMFLTASKSLLEKYRERKIVVIDSLRYSTSLAMLLMYAGQMKKADKSLEETAQWIEEHKECIHQMGPLDDLFFLNRSGRISKMKAVMGTLVGVKPMGDFNSHGQTSVLGNAKGYNNAFKAAVEYIKQTIISPEDQIVFIANSLREEKALKFKEVLEQNFKFKEIIMNDIGLSCGANIGPGLIAVYYFGKKMSKDNVEEKKLMSDILINL